MLETELCFKKVFKKRPAVATLYLLRSPVETAVEYNLPTNLIQNKFYRRCSTAGVQGSEQCIFVKCLSILIAREHKKMRQFINCLLDYNSLYVLL